jgi:hypothetical protein
MKIARKFGKFPINLGITGEFHHIFERKKYIELRERGRREYYSPLYQTLTKLFPPVVTP